MAKEVKRFKGKGKDSISDSEITADEHFGDCKSVGDGIKEMRINFAKGYRVYLKEKDGKIIILLIGGEKSTQQKDIIKAKKIWNSLKN